MKRIILIEDETSVVSFIKKGLQESGYEVSVAFDGKTGVQLVQSNDFDLVILDIMLPEMNGLEVCKEIRKTNQNVPILFLTALGTSENIVLGLESGGDDYLVKPFQFEELLLRINSLLRRKAPSENMDQEIIRIDDLIVNKTEQKVYRGGNEINLTLKEFQLLVYLAEAQGRTVSKQQITEHVWEHNFNTNTNTVEVYINFLRKKIDKDFKVKLIHTRSGFGYYLSPL